MDVLFDTNVIMNFITHRDDRFTESSIKAILQCTRGYFRGYIAFHSLSTIWYVLRKEKTESEVRASLDNICGILNVISASHGQAVRAIRNKAFKDFEDCLQDECAKSVNAQFIVTCNIRDYTCAATTAVTPDQFLAILDGVK